MKQVMKLAALGVVGIEELAKKPLVVAMEQDVQDGKTFHEHEHEFYVEIDDFEQLKNAASVDLQEQWNIKVDKTEGNAAKGALRIRQIYQGDLDLGPNQKPQGEAQYVLTTKVNQGIGKRLEVPIPTTEDAFNLFAMLSDSGMIKHRYHFPVDDLVFEVDMFLNPEGGYYPVAKIDLEVKNMSGEIPELPIKVKSCIMGDTKDSAEKKKISEYYDKYFITKNKMKESAEQVAQEGYSMEQKLELLRDRRLSIAQESAALGWASGGFLALLAVANLFIWGQEKWTKYVKKRDAHINAFDAEVRKMVKALHETFLNDKWLKSQTFKTGKIRDQSIVQWLSVDGKFNPNVVSVVDHTLKTMTETQEAVASAYGSYASRVTALMAPIKQDIMSAPAMAAKPTREDHRRYLQEQQTPERAKLFEKVEAELRKLDHPMNGLWMKLPNGSKILGGLNFSVNSKYDQFDGEYYFKVSAKPSNVDAQIDALTAEQARAIAELIIRILSMGHKDVDLFAKARSAVYQLPAPQDGWPYRKDHVGLDDLYAHANTNHDIYDTMPYVMGSWGEQHTDPIFNLQGSYYYILSQVAEALMRWLAKSVEATKD